MSLATIDFAPTVDMEALYTTVTSEEQIEKANAFRTIPTNTYRLTPTRINVVPAGQDAPVPGRLDVGVQYTAFDRATGDRRGVVFAHFSPELHYSTPRDGGEPFIDKAAKLWGQAVKAFDMKKEPFIVVIRALAQFPLDGYVTEYIRMPDGSYPKFSGADERADLIANGGTLGNSVNGVGRVKA